MTLTILALGSFCIIVNLITIVHLTPVKHLLASDRICHIQTLESSLLVFIGFAWQCLLPVQMGLYWVSILVFFNLIAFITSISGVCQAFTKNRIADIVDKLAIHGVGYLVLIHPESLYGDILHRCLFAPQGILLINTHFQMTSLDKGHSIRSGLTESSSTNTCYLTTC